MKPTLQPAAKMDNRSVSNKIARTTYFVVGASVLAIAVAMIGIFQQIGRVSHLHEQSVLPIGQVQELQSSFQQTILEITQYGSASQADRVRLKESVATSVNEFQAKLATYEPSATHAQNVQDIATRVDAIFSSATDAYFPATDAVLSFHENVEAQLIYEVRIRDAGRDVDALLLQEAQGQQNTAQQVQKDARAGGFIVLLSSGVVTVVAVALALLMNRRAAKSIGSRIAKVSVAVEAAGRGDFTVTTDVLGSDEIGQLAKNFELTRLSLSELTGSIAATAAAISQSAEQLSTGGVQIATSSAQTSEQAEVVSAAAQEVSQNITDISAGSEQLGTSIREIAQNSADAAQVAVEAQNVVDSTTERVTRLGVSSAEIGDAVRTITAIAKQTNLLALNATIEAARAGAAGKGFAVVAAEVQELAAESARAAEDISQRIDAIQTETKSTVDSIAEISSIIATINTYQQTIAVAVEEQTTTTSQTSQSVAMVAGGTGEIAANIEIVAEAISQNVITLSHMNAAIGNLNGVSSNLREKVSTFRF